MDMMELRRHMLWMLIGGGGDMDNWELLIDDTFSADLAVPMNTPKEYAITGKFKQIYIVWLNKAPSTETSAYDNYTGLVKLNNIEVAKPVGHFNKTTPSYAWIMIGMTNLFAYSDTCVHRNNTSPVSGANNQVTAGYIDSITSDTAISKICFSTASAAGLYIGKDSHILIYGVRA